MIVTFRGTGILREFMPEHQENIEVELQTAQPVRDILARHLALNPELVVAVVVGDRTESLDYVPSDGDDITLIAPLAGG